MTILSAIVAVARNGVIGNKGVLPWRIPEDMRWFRSKTIGKPIVMGRRTWESLPKKPLPGRTNIVVTRNRDWEPAFDQIALMKNTDEGHEMIVVWDVPSALDHAERRSPPPDEIVVIGGAELYSATMPQVRRLYLTDVDLEPEGDAFMPAFDRKEWTETFAQSHPPLGDALPGFTFRILERAAV